MQLQAFYVLPPAFLASGLCLLAAHWLLHKGWLRTQAKIVLVKSVDAEWDEIELHYCVASREIETTLHVATEFGLSQKVGESIPILHHPITPERVRIPRSGSFAIIFGILFTGVGMLWTATVCLYYLINGSAN